MAIRLSDGSIKLRDGRVVFANSLVQAQDLLEILELVIPGYIPAPLWPFVSGGGGGGGGAAGVIGADGADGADGAQGNQGFQGPGTGSPGAQGSQGPQGVDGTDGTQGFQGFQGAVGVGVQGAQGNQGVSGTQGFQGDAGIQGSQGNQGLSGAQGVQGAQGFQGDAGIQGSQGNQGLSGAQGVQGAQGAQGSVGAAGSSTYLFYADQLDSPDTSDWAVNAVAPASADSNNSALVVRLFDDTTEEGVGLQLSLPSGSSNIILNFKSRAETAPGATRTVGLKLYIREIPDNGAVGSWSAGTQLTDISIPANENFQYDSQTIAFGTLSLTAGRLYQFELTRVDPTGGTELTGDWALDEFGISFS